MLPTERVISNLQLATAARYLARLAAQVGGYTLRGVSGWAHRHDVEGGTGARQDGQLPRLHSMGLVDRVHVGPESASAVESNRRRPTWTCRRAKPIGGNKFPDTYYGLGSW